MKKILSIFLSLLMLVASLPTVVFASGSTINVSTVAQLKEAFKSAQPGDTVLIEAGEYFVDESVDLKASNSGTADAPITYKANGDVRITGGQRIDTSKFELVKDAAVLKRLKREVRDHIYAVDLSGYDMGSGTAEFVLDNNLMNPARYPNNGYLTSINDATDTVFSFDSAEQKAALLAQEQAAYVVAGFTNGYFWGQCKVTSVDETTGDITLPRNMGDGSKFYIKNLISEIDAVGEYAIDYTNSMLYCYLPEGYETMDAYLNASIFESPFIGLNGAQYINFEGIRFEMISGDYVIETTGGAKNINIKDCEFNYIDAGYAIHIYYGTNINISGNRALHCSGGFVCFSGGKISADAITPGNIVIEDNRITNCGHMLTNINGMIRCGSNDTGLANSIGNSVFNNVIENCSGVYAITPTGNNNKVYYNEIVNVGRQINDGGAIYVGRSNTKYGTEVMYNYIHHLNKDNMYAGVYSDDAYGGIKMSYNVLVDMDHPIHIGMGANAQFNHNIIMSVDEGIYNQSRNSSLYKSLTEDTASKIAAYPILATEYPEMQESVDAYDSTLGYYKPYKSQILGNVRFDGTSTYKYPLSKTYTNITLDKTEYSDNGTSTSNKAYTYDASYFRDPENQDYTLTSSFSSDVSDAKAIDMTKIGFKSGKELRATDKTLDAYAVYADGSLNISWDKPDSATRFTISGAGSDVTYYDNNLDSGYSISGLTPGETYTVKVKAESLARQDVFSVEDTVQITIPETTTKDYLTYATALLDEEIESESVYSDETAMTGMTAAKAVAQATLESESATEAELIASENTVLDALAVAQSKKIATALDIIKCELVENSTKVNVAVSGFEKNSLVSVFVTNPTYIRENLTSDNEAAVIRYTDVIQSDDAGRISYTFDTAKDGVDIEGIYMVYFTASDGRFIVGEYAYGTVELGDITYTVNGYAKEDGEEGDGAEVDIEISADDISSYKGHTVTVSVPLTNRLSTALTPYTSIGLYDGDTLANAFVNKSTSISGGSKGVISIEVDVPETIDSALSAELFVWDGSLLLRPLTVNRVITEIN